MHQCSNQASSGNSRSYYSLKKPTPKSYKKQKPVTTKKPKFQKHYFTDHHTVAKEETFKENPFKNATEKKSLPQRLYVKDANISRMRIIMDYDPEFFKVVEGRPILDPFKKGDYINIVRSTLQTKVVTAFNEDQKMCLEENIKLEKEILDKINKNFEEYKKNFEDFLSQDYTNSMDTLKLAEQEAEQANEVGQEIKELEKNYSSLRSIIYKLEAKWRTCKSFKNFLFVVSPESWKAQQENQEKEDFTIKETEDIEGLIEQFRSDCILQDKPQLFFTEPQQLIKVFKFLEMQNLNCLLHTEELAVPILQVKAGIVQAKLTFDKEILDLESAIQELQDEIIWQDERALTLERLCQKLLNEDFKQLCVSEEVLNLQVYIEDLYETRIGPNNADLTITEMMEAIESHYRKLLLNLDLLPPGILNSIESNYYKEQEIIMKLAEKAAKQFIELERILKSLARALEPPFVKSGKEIKARSPPVEPPKPPVVPQKKLTKEQQEYLDFFTDFCKKTDKLEDFGFDVSSNKL